MLKSILFLLLKKNYRFSGKWIFTLLKFDPDNIVSILSSRIAWSKLIVSGNGNFLEIKSSVINKSQIIVEGTCNKVKIEDGVSLNNIYIAISGSNNKIWIGKNCLFHSGFIYSGGGDFSENWRRLSFCS